MTNSVNIKSAIQQAILNRKNKIKINGKTIELPEPQSAGTEHQIISYASQQTEKTYQKHFG